MGPVPIDVSGCSRLVPYQPTRRSKPLFQIWTSWWIPTAMRGDEGGYSECRRAVLRRHCPYTAAAFGQHRVHGVSPWFSARTRMARTPRIRFGVHAGRRSSPRSLR